MLSQSMYAGSFAGMTLSDVDEDGKSDIILLLQVNNNNFSMYVYRNTSVM